MKFGKRFKVSTRKQRIEMINWISDNSEILVEFFADEGMRIRQTHELNRQISDNYKKQIKAIEKMILDLVLSEEVDKSKTIILLHELLNLAREINGSYRKCYDDSYNELAVIEDKLSFFFAFMNKNGLDVEEMKKLVEEEEQAMKAISSQGKETEKVKE